MSAPSQRNVPRRVHAGEARIADVVFDRLDTRASRNDLLAVVAAVALHGSLWYWARSAEPSLESWSAEMAVRVHTELGRQEVVELAEPVRERVPEPEQAHQPAPPAQERALRPARPSRTPPPPAQAGRIIAQEPSPNAPVDLTADTFVTGTASAYAGGTTTAGGTNPVAVLSRMVDPAAPPTRDPREPDRSSPLRLEGDEWQCAWPHEADSKQIDEQAVVLRVVVGADGRAESAKLVSDPGNGFGQAAVACALRTRFTPARDWQGRPAKAQSPPIRVRFTR